MRIYFLLFLIFSGVAYSQNPKCGIWIGFDETDFNDIFPLCPIEPQYIKNDTEFTDVVLYKKNNYALSLSSGAKLFCLKGRKEFNTDVTTSGFTIDFKFKADSVEDSARLMSLCYDGCKHHEVGHCEINLNREGKVVFKAVRADGVVAELISKELCVIGKWYNIIVQYNPYMDKWQLYVNGKIDSESGVFKAWNFKTNVWDIYLGSHSAENRFEGLIDEVLIAPSFNLGTIFRGKLQTNPSVACYSLLSDNEYVSIKDGHLWANGQRLKLWGAQGSMGNTHQDVDRNVEKFTKIGFNLFRSISVTRTDGLDYKTGDMSRQDLTDYTYASIIDKGGYVWIDLINMFRVKPDDVNITDDTEINELDWLEAMRFNQKSFGEVSKPSSGVVLWDRRTQIAYLKYIDKMMMHINPYRGLSYAQEPGIAVIELVNEQWWIPKALSGRFLDYHPALVRSLNNKWNDWLRDKYKNTQNLADSWGTLMSGESLENGSVLLQPLLGAGALDKMSDVLGIDIKFSESGINEVQSSPLREADIVKFLVNLNVSFKTEAIERIRSHSVSGRGAGTAPILLDTGSSHSPQSTFEHTFGSAFACGTYVHLIDSDVNSDTFPWRAPLKEKPDVSNWLNQNKIQGHPTFIYETMVFAPAKYRADYPLRLLSLATIQDFDVVDWHYYTYFDPATDPLYMPTEDHYWNAVHMGNDEVLLAMSAISGMIFRYGDLKAPENPVIFVVGKDVLEKLSPHWGDYSKYFAATVFNSGMQLKFDPQADKSYFIGTPITQEQVPGIVKPTDQITYLWQEGILKIESDRVRVVAGFLPENYQFEMGEKLLNISIAKHDDSPYQINDERYVCFAMCSTDGKPLDQSSRIMASAVSTSWNTNFEFDLDKWKQLQGQRDHPPLNAGKSVKRGTVPIKIDRVGWTLDADWIKGRQIIKYDFYMNDYERFASDKTHITIDSKEKLFILEIIK